MKRILATLAFTFSLLFVLSACSGSNAPAGEAPVASEPAAAPSTPVPATTAPLTKVSVTLDWFPWSNHSGLFIAQDKGYYAAEGLEVEIHPPADPAAILQTVAAGRDDFGINYQTGVMIARAKVFFMPFMFSGIKVGISVSVIAAVIGEWVGGSAGLGYLITYSQPLFLTSRVFAAIVVLSVMGVSLFLLAGFLERLMLPWYHTEKRARSMERR